MAAVIGAFTFDAMRDHLSPAAYTYSASGGNVQTGKLSPVAGTVITERKFSTNALAVAASASYRAIIGALVDVDINGTAIENVLVIDCRTSLKGTIPNKCLVAEWRLAAPESWNP